jgi:1-acylglycerone phosphate reductase
MSKSVLITGCSTGGIGHALTLSFQKRGLTVFASARNISSMSSLSDLPNVHLIPLDVTSSSSVSEAFAIVKKVTGGKLDYLVNNAGRGYTMPALDVDIEEGKRLFDTNFWGVLRMVQVFAPLLIEARGTVVNIGSIVAYLHSPLTSKFFPPPTDFSYVLSLWDIAKPFNRQYYKRSLLCLFHLDLDAITRTFHREYYHAY